MDEDGAAAREEIIAAKQARATRDRLEARIARERDTLGGAQLELQAARARLASESEPDVRALHGWRREVFGADALALKTGQLALGVAGRRVRLIRTP